LLVPSPPRRLLRPAPSDEKVCMFDLMDFDHHEAVSFFDDPATGLRAIVAIHSTAIGAALGGCRMRPYATVGEAITDALRLSRAMSFKNALGDRPFGGAKAVVIANPATDKTPAMLAAFGRAVDSLGGRYITAEDAGIDPTDIAHIGTATAYTRNIAPERGGPAPYTAYGVFIAIRAAVEQVLQSDLSDRVVSVQGLGGVGMSLCQWLTDAGARLIVSDIDQARRDEAVARFGATSIEADQAHRAEADVFAPCAFGGALNEKSIPELRARIIAGAANNQLSTPQDGQRIADRGIVYCPDYVNAGGIRATEVPGVTFDHDMALRRVEGISSALSDIIKTSQAVWPPTWWQTRWRPRGSRPLDKHKQRYELPLRRLRLSRLGHSATHKPEAPQEALTAATKASEASCPSTVRSSFDAAWPNTCSNRDCAAFQASNVSRSFVRPAGVREICRPRRSTGLTSTFTQPSRSSGWRLRVIALRSMAIASASSEILGAPASAMCSRMDLWVTLIPCSDNASSYTCEMRRVAFRKALQLHNPMLNSGVLL
jgi:leucine dehydrogenase